MAKKIGSLDCAFAGLRFNWSTDEVELCFKPVGNAQKQKAKMIADKIQGIEKLTVTIEKYAEKRSLDANAYFWRLLGELSAVLCIPTTEIYQEYIKEIGGNFEIVPVRNDAKEKWMKNWSAKGEGWLCADLGTSKLEGYTNIKCYYGSSTYDSSQMRRLIQLLKFDCEDQGIETKTPEELERLFYVCKENKTG